MGRRAKPSKGKTEASRPPARKSPKSDNAKVHDPEKRLAEALAQLQTRDRELVEAWEQQTATAEILRVISSSPTAVQPVFDTLGTSAMRLSARGSSVIFSASTASCCAVPRGKGGKK